MVAAMALVVALYEFIPWMVTAEQLFADDRTIIKCKRTKRDTFNTFLVECPHPRSEVRFTVPYVG